MKFSQTVDLTRPDLVVSRRHDAWITSMDHPVYSDEALAFAAEQLGKKGDRNRLESFSPSALGSCQRYQQFVFKGMPKLDCDVQGSAKRQNGVMVHLRWQMSGLTAGWLAQAEVPVSNKELGLLGTMDGLTDTEDIVEIKSINSRGFSRVATFGALEEHQFQMAGYMLCTGLERGVFIYECKDTQDYRELVVTADEMPLELARRRAEELWVKTDLEELYDPLNKCIDREGWMYNSCQFRDRCLKIHDWSEIA